MNDSIGPIDPDDVPPIPDNLEAEQLAYDKLAEGLIAKAEDRFKKGYIIDNLPGLHNMGVKIEKAHRTGAERIHCAGCNKNVFPLMLNGNRLIVDEDNSRTVVVKFSELLAICHTCGTAAHINTANMYESLDNKSYQNPNGVGRLKNFKKKMVKAGTLEGDYNEAREMMTEEISKNSGEKRKFLRSKLLEDKKEL